MLSLVLNANPQGFRDFINRKHDKAFLAIAETVWERDRFECQYCGLLIKKGQEVVNKDGFYQNNTFSNLVTACSLCAQCGFLESIGPSVYGGGILIYLPEINQAYLNSFCYFLFKAMHYETEEEIVAEKMYHSLNVRAHLVERELGDGMSDPSVLGQLLVESGLHANDNTFIADLRLLPMRSAFKDQLAYDLDGND